MLNESVKHLHNRDRRHYPRNHDPPTSVHQPRVFSPSSLASGPRLHPSQHEIRSTELFFFLPSSLCGSRSVLLPPPSEDIISWYFCLLPQFSLGSSTAVTSHGLHFPVPLPYVDTLCFSFWYPPPPHPPPTPLAIGAFFGQSLQRAPIFLSLFILPPLARPAVCSLPASFYWLPLPSPLHTHVVGSRQYPRLRRSLWLATSFLSSRGLDLPVQLPSVVVARSPVPLACDAWLHNGIPFRSFQSLKRVASCAIHCPFLLHRVVPSLPVTSPTHH